VPIQRFVTLHPTVLVASVYQTFVKVNLFTWNLNNISLYITVPTCEDNVMNSNETDVDCGGSCLPSKQCSTGLACNKGSDCLTGVCKTNICQGKSSGTLDE